MKKILYQLVSVGCLSSSLITVAQANSEIDDVVFIPAATEFRNVACNGAARNVTYILQNNEANAITLYDVKVTNQPGEPIDSSGVTFVPSIAPPSTGPVNCLTSLTDNIGSGVISGFNTCSLVITVTPPACTNPSTPLQTPIARQLFIGVQSEQAELVTNINANVSVIGSGENFAVLGGTVANTSQGTSQIIGDLGYTTASAPTGFNVTNGAERGSTDAIRIAAESDLRAAYAALLGQIGSSAGCEPRASLDAGDELQPGYYCLQQNPNIANNNIYVGGLGAPITLVGDGTG
ncbi:MAG: hypothetical protein ACHP9Y_05570, partial [Gammaproteobacteria bacterium]